MVQQAAKFPPAGDGCWTEQRVSIVWMAATDAKGLLAPGDGLSTVPKRVCTCTARVCIPCYYLLSTAEDVLGIRCESLSFLGKYDVSLITHS